VQNPRILHLGLSADRTYRPQRERELCCILHEREIYLRHAGNENAGICRLIKSVREKRSRSFAFLRRGSGQLFPGCSELFRRFVCAFDRSFQSGMCVFY